MTLKTLVLGHGKRYVSQKKYDTMTDEEQTEHYVIKRSPIPTDMWYDDEHTSVDMYIEEMPDIVHNLLLTPWTFAESNSYDRIIDTTGGVLCCYGDRFKYRDNVFNEVGRVLKPGGVFYGKGSREYKKYRTEFKVPYDALSPKLKVKVEYLMGKVNVSWWDILDNYKSGKNVINYMIETTRGFNESEIADLIHI